MKIYKLTQTENSGYDTYDSIIVCSEDEEEAKKICPNGDNKFDTGAWASKEENVQVEYLGEAEEYLEKGIILASFNAG